MQNFFRSTHRRPTWRKAGVHEGFHQVAVKPRHVQRLNHRFGQVWVPKVGWVRFRLSRPVPKGVKSYRVTRDRAGPWHIAFAHVPDPISSPGDSSVVGIDRGVVVSAALSTGELLHAPGLTSGVSKRLKVLQQRLARCKRGLNRAISGSGWGQLIARLQHKAFGRVEQIPAAYTSQRCSACGHAAPENRKSQAVFECQACGAGPCNADVNAARNIAAGRAVTARGDLANGRSANREPQLATPAA